MQKHSVNSLSDSDNRSWGCAVTVMVKNSTEASRTIFPAMMEARQWKKCSLLNVNNILTTGNSQVSIWNNQRLTPHSVKGQGHVP